MLILAQGIGIVILGIGGVVLVKPDAMRKMIAFYEKGRRIYIAGVLRLLFGVICFAMAMQCKFSVVVNVFGILFLLGGIIIFVLGIERLKSMLKWWNEKSDLVIRLLGFLTIGIGVLLLYSI